ncbi:MAG TPA: type II secretion system protein [Candidatus Paceibacterota bacterium]
MTNKNKNTLYPKPYTLKPKKGFTLIEMIVALGLFTVVILVGIGALTGMSAAASKTKATGIVIDNLNFALENMARGMRTGIDYHCGLDGTITEPADCATGSSAIAFRNDSNKTVIFRKNGTSIERSIDGGAFLSITSPEITIDTLTFFVEGAPSGDSLQPKVFIIVRGTAGVREKDKTTFDIQTTISQRIFDI